MEDLLGANHQIKLNIKEGRNFENVIYPTIIVASLNNHSLETDLTQPDNNPQYLTDLIWEAEKKSLRIMRSGQTPLKIECFTLNEEGNREKIGYTLLSLRTAQIISKNENVEIRHNWHSLSGLKGDLKSSKPELLLSLVIEDHLSNSDLKKIAQDTLSYQTITPVLLEHEHLIQLGPIDSCHDLFLITIMTGIVNNLDVLISESILKEQLDQVSFVYHIMDNDIKSNLFNRSAEKQWILNDKIDICIRSSLSVLRNYFQIHPYLLICLKLRDSIVAQSKLDVRPLIFTDSISQFLKKTSNGSTSLEQHCILIKEHGVTNAHEPKASLGIKFKIKYVDTRSEPPQSQKNPSHATLLKPPSEINQRISDNQMKSQNVDAQHTPVSDFELYPMKSYTDLNALQYNQFSNLQDCWRDTGEPNFETHCPKNIETFHCYCLNIYLTGIKLTPACPLIRNFEFRFHHPKAQIMSTLHPAIPVMSGGKLSLQNIGYKLHFISSSEEIRNLLTSFPPRISVCDDSINAKICIAQTLLDVQQLFNQHKRECQYEASLINADGNQVGTLDVIMNLQDQGPYYNDKSRNAGDNLGPPILDDSLVYKIVDELETWKERQKESFRTELRKKEEHYLNLLGEEWRKKKETLEAKLASSVEQCKKLAISLNNATEDLRMRRLKNHEKEERLLKINEDLQKKYEAKIHDLRLASEKMQNDFSSRMAFYEDHKHSYETQLDHLKRENEQLKQTLKTQREHLMEYEKGSLSPEQTTSLLQEVKNLDERLAKSQETVNYYKKKLSMVLSDLQNTKLENQQLLEMQIKSTREEYKMTEYEDILSANTAGLTSDQLHLDQVQKELGMIRPKSARLITDSETISVPLNSLFSKPNDNFQKQSFLTLNEREAKLHALTENKDTLLKTGSYLNDDPIIQVLNSEIRTLI